MSEHPFDDARTRARRHGFVLLFGSALLGFSLEAAHALKLSGYLDVPLRRELLTLAHAHGVGLSLVLLAYAALGAVDRESAALQRTLSIGCVLLPLGFALGSFGLHESDPGLGIVLAPLGGLLVLRALYGVMRAAYR